MDRVLRIGVGVVLVGLAAAGRIGPWGCLGVVPLLNGLVRFCPASTLLGFDTCGTKR